MLNVEIVFFVESHLHKSFQKIVTVLLYFLIERKSDARAIWFSISETCSV